MTTLIQRQEVRSSAMKRDIGSNPYVPAIDGMRAVAVIGVLVYHLKFAPANGGAIGAGGFAGVDIFFVISGYLISRIIFGEIDANQFSFTRFYARRIRRIAPAMFATLFLSSLTYLLLFSPAEFGAFRHSLEATIFSVSNIYFYETVDYFHNAADIPLLHTWSLAVEEQFYFLFPALIAFWPSRFRHTRVALLIFLATLSFVSALYLTASNQAAAFYFPTSRWWELMAGSILAAYNPARAGWEYRKVLLSWAGAIGIGLSFVFLNDSMPYPGYRALLPVASACALIIGARSPSLINVALTTRPVRWVGDISYSLYLVHWPVISFLTCFMKVGKTFSLAAILISVTLAWTSWKYVETPFRTGSYKRERKLFVVFVCSSALLMSMVAAESIVLRLFWNQYPEAQQFQSYFEYDATDVMEAGKCFLTPPTTDLPAYKRSECLKLALDQKNILLIGDSHLADLTRGFQTVFPNIHFLQASASGCQPVIGATGKTWCSELMNYIYQDWIPAHRTQLEAVVLSARWQDADISNLEQTLNWLSSNSIKSVVMGPSPEFIVPLPRLLAYSAVAKNDALVQLFLVKERLALNKRFESDVRLSDHYLSVSDSICDGAPSAMRCNVTFNGAPLFFDRDHFTPEGSIHIIDQLSKGLLDKL